MVIGGLDMNPTASGSALRRPAGACARMRQIPGWPVSRPPNLLFFLTAVNNLLQLSPAARSKDAASAGKRHGGVRPPDRISWRVAGRTPTRRRPFPDDSAFEFRPMPR